MFEVVGTNISMNEGEFGLSLSFDFPHLPFINGDELRFRFTNSAGEVLFEKTYTDLTNRSVDFALLASESAKLPRGTYFYSVSWIRGQQIRAYPIPVALFCVR